MKQWDANDPEKFGAVGSDASWNTNPNGFAVYAPTCLMDFHELQLLGPDYKRLDYNENWPPLCALTGTQTSDSWRPVVFDPNSINYAPNAAAARKLWWCGSQD